MNDPTLGGLLGPLPNMPKPKPAGMTEAQLQRLVEELCRTLGLLAYHPYDSRRSEEGFPDLVIVGPGTLFRELKKGPQPSLVRPEQKVWLSRLRLAGADADVWTPQDWPVRITAELRGTFTATRPLPWTLAQALAEVEKAKARKAKRDLVARGRRMGVNPT